MEQTYLEVRVGEVGLSVGFRRSVAGPMLGRRRTHRKRERAETRRIEEEPVGSLDDEAFAWGGERRSVGGLVALVLALAAWVVLAEFVWGLVP